MSFHRRTDTARCCRHGCAAGSASSPAARRLHRDGHGRAILRGGQRANFHHLRAGAEIDGHLRLNLPLEVESNGTATSPNVTHDPPSTVGAGIVEAVADVARFWPLIVMKEAGKMLVLPSLAFTMPVALALMTGGDPEGVSDIALRHDNVIA